VEAGRLAGRQPEQVEVPGVDIASPLESGPSVFVCFNHDCQGRVAAKRLLEREDDGMPELPEVETKRRYIEKTSLGQEIAGIKVSDRRILQGVTPQGLARGLEGQQFESVTRRAKYLMLGTSGGSTVLMHFGMTGDVLHGDAGGVSPKFERVAFDFTGGRTLRYVDMRLFGKIALYQTLDGNDIPDIARLGPEPLGRAFTLKKFADMARSHKVTVHQLLMDQGLIAGIGNLYSDEICYQAKVLPARTAQSLSDEEVRCIYDKIKWTLRRAIDLGADLDEQADVFLIPNRGKGGTCPRGHPLEKKTIGGRTSWYCPAEQK
jgi:formamidopyrimidine-DNA glycosylase